MPAPSDRVSSNPATPRIGALDTARGLALFAMASYHFTWDLELFGYLEPGTATQGLWRLYARAIASSFLFLAGFSLVLAHYRGIRWQAFGKRFLMIAGAAAAITAATAIAVPEGLIFFGILHNIAAASLIGLLLLRVPVALIVVAALAVIAAPQYLRSTFFDTPWLWWVGLNTVPPRSNDYVPLLPWFGPFLFGIAAARIAIGREWLQKLAALPSGPSILGATGRHSLAFYLLHQPILIAVVYLFSAISPPQKIDPVQSYLQSCQRSCTEQQDSTDMCSHFCSCTVDRLMEQNLFDALQSGAIRPGEDERVQQIANQCSAVAF